MLITEMYAFGAPQTGGNRAVIVEHAMGLTSAGMQDLARNHRAPVTVSVKPCPEADCEMRFFSVGAELPFCAHGMLPASGLLMQRLGHAHLLVRVGERVVEAPREDDLFTLHMKGYQSKPCPTKELVLSALGATAADVSSDLPFLLASLGS